MSELINGVWYDSCNDGFTEGWTVAGYDANSMQDDVIVRTEIRGLPVIAINLQAFMNAPMTTISFPDTIKEIGAEAFKNCKNLKQVYRGATRHPEARKKIFVYSRVFEDCDNLEMVFMGQKTAISLCGAGNFSGCKKLKIVEGKITSSLPASSFRDCNNLQNLHLFERVDFFETCFINCNSLAQLYFENTNCIKMPEAIKDVLRTKIVYCDKGSKAIQDLAYEGLNVTVLETIENFHGI